MARAEVKSAAMKELVALLNAFDDRDESDVALFRQLLGDALEEALPELSDRMVRPSTSWTLKRLILASPAHFPHPDWTPLLQRALMHETDAELFEEGCRALAQRGGEAETDALRQVAWQRQEPELQPIVSRKLAFLEPRQPFSYHFRDLLLGSQNPRLSTQAAQHLAGVARVAHLGDLTTACDHPDNMTCLHALRVIAAIQRPEAARFLMERFAGTCEALLLDNWLRSAQEQIKRAPAQSVKNVVLELLRSCPGSEPHTAVLAGIDAALEDPASDALSLVQRLRADIQGVREVRLVDCLADLAIGRSVRLANLMPEPPEESRLRTQRLQGTLDACAEGLTRFSRRGILPKAEVLPLFQRAYEGGAGGDGFGRSFAELLDDEDEAQRELILAATNHRWREEGITVLGERVRPSLLTFFLKAMADPIVDIAQLAIRYFGRLPGAFETAMELFRSGKADQMERALDIFSLNAMTEAGPLLLDYLGRAEREDTMIGVVRCLGALRYPSAIEPLVELVRGGQSLRLQRAVAESLLDFGTQEAARGLLSKAVESRNAEVQLLAVEAISRVRSDFNNGLRPDECLWVERALDGCFEEGGGFRLRGILAAQNLWTLDQVWLERLEKRLGEIIAEQRKRPTWDREQQQAVASVMRELERKRREQGLLVSSGNPVRELVMAYVPGDHSGVRILQALASIVADPAVVLGPETRAELEALVGSELPRPGIDEGSLEWLCRLGGRVQAEGIEEPLLDLLSRCGPESVLRKTCLDALRAVGCAEAALSAPPSRREILLLEPSAFFRRRQAGFLLNLSVREAQDREEAEALMRARAVDVLVSELTDAAGDLQDWFGVQWRSRRARQVILSTSSRSIPGLLDKPWFAGALFKPYPMEDLLALLQV